jgi:hypothetical protein
MSKQNVNDWTDKFGTRLEIGQRIAGCRGKTLHVGKVLWFTKSGVTIDSEGEAPDGSGEPVRISIPYHTSGSYHLGPHKFYVISQS